MKPYWTHVKSFSVFSLGIGCFLMLTCCLSSFAETVTVTSQVVATDIETIDFSTDGTNIGVTVSMNQDANAQGRAVSSNMVTKMTPKNPGDISTMGKCGDDICDSSLDEDTSNCPEDCLNCGDGQCSTGETCESCVVDCGECQCGNGTCQAESGEDCSTCYVDCGACCGNGTCQPGVGETHSTCEVDCPACGDGICGTPMSSENCSSCPADCGACASCGDGTCNGSETCSSCSSDCGACPAVCGDEACNGSETCSSCSQDCGTCGTCFLAGTLITMGDGSTRSIEKIKTGDIILAYDEATQQFKPDKVTKLLRHVSDGYLIINGHLKVTANHPVFSNGEWVNIGKLKEGDTILNQNGQMEIVASKEWKKGKVKTYNMEVNPFHTYIAGGIVVHNAAGKGTPNME